MRPFYIVSLLILLILLTKAQGIRLGKVTLAFEQEKHDEENTLLKRSNTINDANEAILCNDKKQCTGNIKNRKSVTTSISTTKSLSKNVKNREDVNVNEEAKDIKVKSMTTSKYYATEDLVDITEMDYSPARRKPPIHN
ncbi:uncharacterized protein [Cicer arietinum]|uniref:Uncharacterized protein LOC101508391 n=1 Tax=Cicer arietinum TaxID=3827 RepID=A0A1S2YQM3_CICAR|nr:uncharacterized protein LOC101508391 [Cicer arietinum]